LLERGVLAFYDVLELLPPRGNSSGRDYDYLFSMTVESGHLLHETGHNFQIKMVGARGKKACAELGHYAMVRH